MDAATLAAVGGIAGLVGGVAGLIAAIWTIVWAVTLRPRVRWSLNRFDEQPPIQIFGGRPIPPPPGALSHLRFYFRNTGTAAADDAHAIIAGGMWEKPVEFPPTGRQRIEPGQEIVVETSAPVVDGKLAGRPYPSGTDSVFDLRGVKVKVRWRRQTWGFATRSFKMENKQFEVPFV